MTHTATASTRITPEHAQLIGGVTNGTVVLLALVAAVLSYDGLYRLAHIAGVPGGLSALLPVVIDGLTLVGSLSTVYAALANLSTRWPWTLVLIGVSASVTGNVLAARPGPVPGVVAATPPVVLALALETALRLARHRAALGPVHTRRKRSTVQPPATVGGGAPVAATPPVASSSSPMPAAEASAPTAGARVAGTRARVAAKLAENPDISAAAIARELGIDPSTIRKHVRAVRGANPHVDATLAPAHLHAVGA